MSFSQAYVSRSATVFNELKKPYVPGPGVEREKRAGAWGFVG